jgi:hypothetical protein
MQQKWTVLNKMNNFNLVIATILFATISCSGEEPTNSLPLTPMEQTTFFKADNPYFQYIGRIDFSNPLLPRFWASGVYIKAKFKGTECSIEVNDEMLWGNSHNYISVSIDGNAPQRIKLATKSNIIKVAEKLQDGEHTILICKSTESGIGYLEFVGMQCRELLDAVEMKSRKIEFIGNSITCAMGSDASQIQCGKGVWYDQHNAFMGYAPLTARALNAEWMLTAVSGIGLMKSCCEMKQVMPEIYESINLREGKLPWDFATYQPDLVSVCLGQNDGVQDSTLFCSNYVKFIDKIRKNNPEATIVLLTSPMGDETLTKALTSYLSSVISHLNSKGETNISAYVFKKQYVSGCDYHPNFDEHRQISEELTTFIKQLKKW